MPFSKEVFDKMLVELVDDQTSEGRKSIIAHELRKDYEENEKWVEENGKKVEDLKVEHKTLLDANLRLFKAGNASQEIEKPKSFSQTITIDEIERKYRQY
jgi:hypothetical protein